MAEGGPRIIAPVDFRNRSRPPRPDGRRSRFRWITRLLLVALVGVLAVAAWFFITARRVQLTFEPQPQRVELTGPALRFKLAGRYLLRPGTYTVRILNARVNGEIKPQLQTGSIHVGHGPAK